MVLPLLYGLGARDFLEPAGFLVLPCQKCGTTGVFAGFRAKRKVTFYTVPTATVREQFVVECGHCQQRFAVPETLRDEFVANLLSEQEAIARVRQLGAQAGGFAIPGARHAAGPTYYQILQVDPAADPDVIDAAFRRLALKHHPDRAPGPEAAAKMRELLTAKEVLSDPERRRAYDASIGIVRRPPAMRPDEV
jgi:hypothetical protein